MTQQEAKAEFEKLAKDSGLSAEQTASFLQAFDNEKFAGAVGNGYARHSEYSSALDKAKTLQATNAQYEKWYQEQASPAMEQARGLAERLTAYEAKYGKLDNATSGEKQAVADAAGISEEKLNKILEQRTNAMSAAFVDYERTMGDLRETYRDMFKERLPVKDLEKFMAENKITDLERGFELFTRPKQAAVQKTEREEERKRDREEWEKDFRSRNQMPKTQPIEKKTLLEELNEQRRAKDYDKEESESKAREAFVTTWNENSAA